MSFNSISNFRPREEELLPEGNYRAWINRVNDSQLDTEYGFVALNFQIIQEGPCKEKTIEQLLNLKGQSQKSRDYAEDMLSALLRTLGFNHGVGGWDDLLHKPMEIIVKTNEWNGQKRSQVSGYRPDPFGGAAPAHQQMPPQQMPPQQMPPQQMPPQQMPPQQIPPQQIPPQQQYQQQPQQQMPPQQMPPQQQYQQQPQQQYQQQPQQQYQQQPQQQSNEDFDDDIPF